MNPIVGQKEQPQNTLSRAWLYGPIVLITVVVTLLMAEVGLRAVAFVTHNVRGATYDPELGWRLVSGITKKDAQWAHELPAQTNSHGWRDDDFTAKKPSGITRVVALGDSFTFGFGVDFGQRFSEVLERDVQRFEVLNLGVFAYGTDQEVRVYELYGSKYQPDIVILNVYLGNDIEDLRMKQRHSWPKPYFLLSDSGLAVIKPKRSWSVFARNQSYIAELLIRLIETANAKPRYADELRDANMVPVFYALLERLENDVKTNNAKLLIVLIHPQQTTYQERVANSRISSELLRRQHNVLDLHSGFEELAAAGRELYLPDGHWNPAGHQLAADMIRVDMVNRGWISP